MIGRPAAFRVAYASDFELATMTVCPIGKRVMSNRCEIPDWYISLEVMSSASSPFSAEVLPLENSDRTVSSCSCRLDSSGDVGNNEGISGRTSIQTLVHPIESK